MSAQYSIKSIDYNLLNQSIPHWWIFRAVSVLLFSFWFLNSDTVISSCMHLDVLLQVLILGGELLCKGNIHFKGWLLLLNGPPERVPWFMLPLTVSEYIKNFAFGPCKSLLPQILSSFVSAKPKCFFQEHHALSQSFAWAHFILFVLYTRFYWIEYLFMFYVLRP